MQVDDRCAVYQLIDVATLWNQSFDLIKSNASDLILSQKRPRGRPKGSKDAHPRKQKQGYTDMSKRKFCTVPAGHNQCGDTSSPSSSDDQLADEAPQKIKVYIPNRCRQRTEKHKKLVAEIAVMCQQLSRYRPGGLVQQSREDVLDTVMKDLLGEGCHSCEACGNCRPCPCTSDRFYSKQKRGREEEQEVPTTTCSTYSEAIIMNRS
ncbi:hypothetical protein GUITHDRAFT_137528 [Guillardia theta CCMP2712]|uniref:Uncharacterized protein n=1 Tax=Guillardia theta (strain CCMP2712) TaxID=905079 RepID=L1JGB3_GUITC|nr:hypothetical protein GUITHDRAFT_137528 [Guillardia theta CCMP2712]EKX47347.1 hypothetical protein GUITHDRAFT_137528 [Guillardia theta CCMP2712]|eukprot:XP_005834327.1 hypothetical protein GUITHDRAFT_137528 [Guillardia theta CCMP2712]